jgi:hypothetical protein
LQDVAAKRAAADSVESDRRVGLVQCVHQLGAKTVAPTVQDAGRAEPAKQLFLLVGANDVHERYPVLQTNLLKHLTKIRGGRGVNDPAMPLPPGSLHKAESR